MSSDMNLGSDLIQELRRGMVHDDAWQEVEGGFEYWIGGFRQRVTAAGPFESHGESVWRVLVVTDCLKLDGPDEKVAMTVVGSNARKLCYCGFIPGENPGEICLASDAFAHAGNVKWIIRPLFQACTQHFVHCLRLKSDMPEVMAHFQSNQSAPPKPGDNGLANSLLEQTEQALRNPREADSYVGAELEALTEAFQVPPCVMCNGSDDALTAEFPFAEWTQMLTINWKHREFYGRGVELLLRLPLKVSPSEAAEKAVKLNEIETEKVYPGHLLGSWCADDTMGITLSFCQFVPQTYLQPNILTNFTFSMVARARWVDETLNQRSWDEIEDRVNESLDTMEDLLPDLDEDTLDAMGEIAERIKRDEDAADPVFRRFSDTAGVLDKPLEVFDDFFDLLEETPLFHYGIFNPMGPTWCIVGWVAHPDHDYHMLCCRILNPFRQNSFVLATLPGLTEDAEVLFQAVEEAFKRNGTPESPLIGGMPSWVYPEDESSVFTAKLALESYYNAHKPDLRLDVALMRKYKGNPWDRATEAMKTAMEGMKKPSLLGKLFGKKSEPAPVEYKDWEAIVFDKDHLTVEMSQTVAAWKGAVEFLSSSGPNALDQFDKVMDVNDLLELLVLLGSFEGIAAKHFRKR